MLGNIHFAESECSMEKLEDMQWSCVGQEDASEIEAKRLQGCCVTQRPVDNDSTKSTTRSK